MFASLVFYAGLIVAFLGLILVFVAGLRQQGFVTAVAGVLVALIALLLPVHEHRVPDPRTQLDLYVPVWQFRELHAIRVAAPPERVFEAIRSVRADEILFFRTLTWFRRFGRPLPESILNAGDDPLIDIATRSGFVRLAEDPPRELVIGTMVVAPPGAREPLTPDMFKRNLSPGYALAAMNFVVTPDRDGSIVSTETRVFANSAASRRGFAKYWRVIYPGSAMIRRMWLRAVARRAEPV